MDRSQTRLECLKVAAQLHQSASVAMFSSDAVVATAEKFASFVNGPPSADNQSTKLGLVKAGKPADYGERVRR